MKMALSSAGLLRLSQEACSVNPLAWLAIGRIHQRRRPRNVEDWLLRRVGEVPQPREPNRQRLGGALQRRAKSEMVEGQLDGWAGAQGQ